MVAHDQIESMVDGFSEPVDAEAFVTEWWENTDGRRLPGEVGAFTVFAVEFGDGCRFFDYVDGDVFDRLTVLMAGPLAGGSDDFVGEHVQRMPYLVRCVASGLDPDCASQLLNQLVSGAPRDVYFVADTAVIVPDCWLVLGEPEPEVMSFAEWMNTQVEACDGENPK